MKKFLLTPILFFILSAALAHPAIGIVKDSKGNIYYSDTKQVWKIDVNGKHTVVVPNVHTHELYMDTNDNLYGEHLWYEESKQDPWLHYVWCLKNTGELVKVRGPENGLLAEYSFVRDATGNMYWVERFTTSRFKKKTPDGVITTIAEYKAHDIRWMYATPTGIVYFIDFHDLYKIDTSGAITLLAKDLANNGIAPGTGPANDIFGIWTDAEQNVYCAVLSDRLVKKITPEGVVSLVAKSADPWMPTGGIFDNAGNLWLLECNTKNEQRARKVTNEALAANGQEPTTGRGLFDHWIPVLTGILLLIALVALIKRFTTRFKCSPTN